MLTIIIAIIYTPIPTFLSGEISPQFYFKNNSPQFVVYPSPLGFKEIWVQTPPVISNFEVMMKVSSYVIQVE